VLVAPGPLPVPAAKGIADAPVKAVEAAQVQDRALSHLI